MPRPVRRGSPDISPMPARLGSDAQLRISDQGGRIVRAEVLPAGTYLHQRLKVAHQGYQRDGWRVDPLRPGAWAFSAVKAAQRLLVGISAASAAPVAQVAAHQD